MAHEKLPRRVIDVLRRCVVHTDIILQCRGPNTKHEILYTYVEKRVGGVKNVDEHQVGYSFVVFKH